MTKATFAAGCFWGAEDAFRRIEGVTETAVGYSGGTVENPTYGDVCSGTSNHAEVVHVEYDPSRVSFDDLLDAFWDLHDPTTLNRQGPDVGTQYRSAVFVHSAEQEESALASRERQQGSGKHRGNIVTEVTPASAFYPAEEYHQQYVEKSRRKGRAP